MNNKFPLWKNLLLITIACLGLVYAIPNVYPELAVVQISLPSGADASALKARVEKALDEAKLAYSGLKISENGLEVSFKSTDAQLAAQDLLLHELGGAYTIALNLVPSTPKWLSLLGAAPMKQGLDLRGGVHFLLDVDVEAVIAHRYEGMVKSMTQNLREQNIRYSGVRFVPNKGIELRFRDAALVDDAQTELQKNFSSLTFTPSKTTMSLGASLTDAELDSMRQNTIDQTMAILRNRVNELGVGEAVVQQQGSTRIAVDLPGIQDAARAKDILGGTATLQFHLVDQQNDAQLALKTGAVPLNSKLYFLDGQPILLYRQVVLSGDSITSAVSSLDQQSATPSVDIQLGGGGESFFTKTTRENIGKRMAIVFVENKTVMREQHGQVTRESHREERVISAPMIQNALGSNFQITGLVNAKEASNLALLLRAGALPAAIYPVEERTVGPSLGQENITRGILSLEVGMGLILVLMLCYYRLFGLIADVALLLNLVLLCAVLSIIGATLTLPGIAGIVLTVGMAVDANVLIYERIREELRHGISIQHAIYAGYERAFATIMDANITTFIVAVVLFSIGTGPIRGFAITLSLGLLTSMLTGVTYTRAMVNWIYGGRAVKKLSIGI